MSDSQTILPTYDIKRGEPRGKLRKGGETNAAQGDCIDCFQCVQVCPTGVDIRDGQQLGCITCGLCLDACDAIMDKIGKPRGLIRYATQHSLDEGGTPLTLRRVFRPRVLIYSTVLVLIGGAFVASLALRSPLRVDVVRDRGTLARLVEDGRIENVYRLQVMNTTESTQRYRFAVEGIVGAQANTRGETVLAPAESRWVPVAVQISPEQAQALGPGAHKLVFRVTREADAAAPQVTVDEKSTFVVPR